MFSVCPWDEWLCVFLWPGSAFLARVRRQGAAWLAFMRTHAWPALDQGYGRVQTMLMDFCGLFAKWTILTVFFVLPFRMLFHDMTESAELLFAEQSAK